LLDPSSYDGDLEKVGKAITLEVHHNHLLIDGEYSLKISWALQAAHGHWGESGGLQGLLESANLRIIGSSPLASALGLDKEKTKVILQAANIPVVEGRNLSLGSTIEEFTEACLMVGFPCFVKAQHLGSSLGVERCHSLEEAHLARQKISHLDTHLLIEQKSRELNILVGCLGTKKTLTPLWHEP
jgi:D-alanine-D-alanine ligase